MVNSSEEQSDQRNKHYNGADGIMAVVFPLPLK
jgi:hypothetical protein